MRGSKRLPALLLAFTLLLSGAAFAGVVPDADLEASEEIRQELSYKYVYNFENDALRLLAHEDGRTYGSPKIAELARQYRNEPEEYFNALARVGVVAFLLQPTGRMAIIGGSDYPNGGAEREPVVRLFPVEQMEPYHDVSPDAWYFDAVMEAAVGGLIYCDENGAFRPDEHLTGSQLAAILCRIYGLYTHVSDPLWYGPYVDALSLSGLAFSSCLREFAQDEVTRGEAIEAMLLLVRAQGREKQRSLGWGDVEDASLRAPERQAHSWSEQALLDALNWRVVDGRNAAHRLDPNGPLTRAALCQMLQNIGVTDENSVSANAAYKVFKEDRALP